MAKYLLFLLSSIFLYKYAPSSMNKEYMLLEVAISLFFTIIFFIETRKNCRMGVFSHSHIFVIVFFVIFYQSYIDYILGFIDTSEKKIWINISIVAKSLGLCNIAMASFLLGYKYQLTKHNKYQLTKHNKYRLAKHNKFQSVKYNKYKSTKYSVRSKLHSTPQKTIFPEKKFLCNIGYCMLAYFVIAADDGFFRSGYLTSEGQLDGSFGIMVILQSVMIAVFSLYCIEYKNNCKGDSIIKYFKRPGILVGLYAIAIILSGRRTEALRVVIMLLFAYIYVSGNRLKIKRTIAYLFVGVILTGVFGAIRGEGQSFSQGVEILTSNNTISPFTKELASSINTVHIAMDNVPEFVPYNYGVTFFPSFSLLVPGLDRLITYLMSNGIALNSSTQISNMYWGGPDWGYGMGSSIVADVYISFGVIGVLIVFLLIGRLFRKLEVITTNSKNIYMFAMCIGVYSQILYACRTGVGVLFLSWTYACIIIYLSKILFHKRLK